MMMPHSRSQYSTTVTIDSVCAVPSASGEAPECHFAGKGLFYGLGVVDPKNAENVVYFSGTLHKRENCITVGEGW